MQPLHRTHHTQGPGLPQLLLIGVDHRSAPVELREKVTYDTGESEDALARLLRRQEIDEACLLSTCNRTEIYLTTPQGGDAYGVGLQEIFLHKAPEIEREGRFYVKRDTEAARHLLEVASGLQSMVLGEPEILGQLRQAAGRAEASGAARALLKQLLQRAIAAGGRSRSETAIGSGPVSFGYATVDLARNIFRRLEQCSVLMIGAGEIARQVSRSLLERGAGRLLVTNRSPERAASFREVFQEAEIVPFERRHRAAAGCNVVVATTGARQPILTRQELRAARGRRSGTLLMVDLGVPRNIEQGVDAMENIFLHDVDSLEALISQNLRRRREEIPKVHEILDRELDRFAAWCRGLGAEPVVAEMQRRAEDIRRREVEASLHRFPKELHGDLEQLSRSLVRKILHHPSRNLRGAAGDPARLDWVRELFRLDRD